MYLSFVLSAYVFNHFYEHGKKLYRCMKTLGFPRGLFLKEGEQKLVGEHMVTCRREKRSGKWYAEMEPAPKLRGGAILSKGYESLSAVCDCAHTALQKAALCLGVNLDMDLFMDRMPPARTKDGDILRLAKIVKHQIELSKKGLFGMGKGGPVFEMLSQRKNGVFIAFAKVKTPHCDQSTNHFFVYDSDYKEGDQCGALVDPLGEDGLRLILDSDREDPVSARRALDLFLGGRVQINKVYRVFAVE